MKKIVLAAALAVSFLLCACAAKAASGPASYVGNTYAGKSPWGENLSVTVQKYDAGNLEIAYEENYDAQGKISCAISVPMKDGTTGEFVLKGTQKDENGDTEYDYSMRLELKDGAMAVTFLDGQKTTLSPEGGSGFHHAGALEEGQKTVTLTKK